MLTYDPQTSLLSIFVQAGAVGTATALTDTSKAKPVPDIVLGQNQSFIEAAPPSGIDDTTDTSENNAGFQSELVDNTNGQGAEITKILNPAVEGEMIATSSPEFRGRGVVGASIKIILHSPTEYTATVKVGADGTWSWTPPEGLDPGSHTLTIEYTDENNVLQRVTRTFTVLAADTSNGLPAFTATPSATPVITPTPAATPTATPSAGTTMPATESAELVDSGALSNTIGLVGLGILLLLVGKKSKKWIKN